MLIKILIVIAMLAILFSLFRSLYFLTTSTEKNSDKTVKNLSWRIGLSILLFVLLIIGVYTGIIDPHGLPLVEEPAKT
ncbi:twin transmembrane helix small protein [Aliikangiella sp. G2MR2-5]|uniref:twin transmembrane helix small protein n=1 Tax=Aliikangiella sp. G2MR2-5 TaxID=2788943 RepID=UPI0018A93C5C|nr:twin transmembrane helix small protein [Aliikangiella sp. G2MR2-5]